MSFQNKEQRLLVLNYLCSLSIQQGANTTHIQNQKHKILLLKVIVLHWPAKFSTKQIRKPFSMKFESPQSATVPVINKSSDHIEGSIVLISKRAMILLLERNVGYLIFLSLCGFEKAYKRTR